MLFGLAQRLKKWEFADKMSRMVQDKNTEKISWKNIRTIVSGHSKPALIGLVQELYSLSAENQNYIHAKFELGDSLKHYKTLIRDAIYPDRNHPIRLSEARKAISQYKKAVGDPLGELELMVYYVECGNQLTLDFGDIDEPFYNSMISMFANVVKKLQSCDESTNRRFVPRLHTVVQSADGIGWGYHDNLSDIFYGAFAEFGR